MGRGRTEDLAKLRGAKLWDNVSKHSLTHILPSFNRDPDPLARVPEIAGKT